MHFSRPSGQRLSWWRPWKRGAVGSFSNGYCSVTTLRNIVRKVTPNPATGSQNCSFIGGHRSDSSCRGSWRRAPRRRSGHAAVRKVSGAAAPRTAPPVGIGGTGKPPRAGAGAASTAAGSSSPSSPKKNSTRNSTARTAEARSATYGGSDAASPLAPISRETARMVATARIHTSAIGISRFQPKAMNWS